MKRKFSTPVNEGDSEVHLEFRAVVDDDGDACFQVRHLHGDPDEWTIVCFVSVEDGVLDLWHLGFDDRFGLETESDGMIKVRR